MKHATTRMIFSYWDSLRGERMAPERGEIEPGEIRHVLADTFILEVVERNAVIRLAGTWICAFFGRERSAPLPGPLRRALAAGMPGISPLFATDLSPRSDNAS